VEKVIETTTGFEYLTQGRFFDAILQPFIDIGGANMVSFVLLSFVSIALLVLYLKTKSIEASGAVFLILSALITPYLPALAQKYFLLMIIAGVALLIVRLLWKKRVVE
jgi:hypothetical protein